MHPKATAVLATVLGALLLGVSQVTGKAYPENWEGAHNEPSTSNRAANGWYAQVVSQKAAKNGIPPSIEILFKRGNIWQWEDTHNTPLYGIEINGFDNDGKPFANAINFNTSSVAPTRNGATVGVWGEKKEVTFYATPDRKHFSLHLNTDYAKGSITFDSQSPAVTGCGGRQVSDDPFFSSLVKGRKLTTAEDILFNENGLRITMFASDAKVDMTIEGKRVKFSGNGYKDTHWTTNPFNDFTHTWHVMIGGAGPYKWVTMLVKPLNGTHLVNLAHLLEGDKLVASQCNLVGQRQKDISIIKPYGEVLESGVTAPTGYELTFVLKNGKKVAFKAPHIAANPVFSFYHRWVTKLTGGPVGGPTYTGYGLNEWINGGNFSHWVDIYKQ